jgi:DNA processing protein
MKGRLAALNLPGIGNQSIRKAEVKNEIFSDIFSIWCEQVGMAWSNNYGVFTRQKAWDLASRQIETIEKLGGEILCPEGSFYPEVFSELSNPPMLISVLGDSSLLKRRGVAIIGTRKPSESAKNRSYLLGRECAKEGRVAVSGLALGCDTLAHWGALSAKGKTIAVLPSDLSRIVPQKNGRLARQIVEHQGLLISEVFPEIKLEPYHFVQRNRLIAALSEWILVVEAEKASGSMHTVRMGRKLSRKIGVALSEGDCMGEGCQWILDQSWGCSFRHLKNIL